MGIKKGSQLYLGVEAGYMTRQFRDRLALIRRAFWLWVARYHRWMAFRHQWDAKAADHKALQALCDWALL